MSYYLQKPIDVSKHNEETERVWAAFRKGCPERVPVSIYGSIRVYIQNPVLNKQMWTFKDYFENVSVQMDAQVAYQKWQRFNVVCDHKMGLPDDGWHVYVDFQNSYDAAWMGCPIRYFQGGLPDTIPILAEHKEALYDMPKWVDESKGLMPRAKEFYEQMLDACSKKEYHGLPLLLPAKAPMEGTDGPLDLAYKLRGAENLLIDMLTDENYYHDLMQYITENLIKRIKRMKEYRWKLCNDSADKGKYKTDNYTFADDAIALLSQNQYKEFVYPYHKRFFDEFSTGASATMHLCGDATRHFRFLRDVFNVKTFETGFPVDFAWLREELGEDVTIYGGPTVMLIKDGNAESIDAEVKRICRSGIMRGGKFVMIAANNLAPMTPVENIMAMYEAVKSWGKYVQ